MAETFEYKLVQYDRKNKPLNETEPEGVVKLLNANGAQGWDLVLFDDSDDRHYRNFLLKRRNPN